MVIRFFRFSGISFPLIALSNIAVDLYRDPDHLSFFLVYGELNCS